MKTVRAESGRTDTRDKGLPGKCRAAKRSRRARKRSIEVEKTVREQKKQRRA